MAICLVRGWYMSFFASEIADRLSARRIDGVSRGPIISVTNVRIHLSSLAAYVIATYSDSAVDCEVISCFLELQLTAPPSRRNTYPDIDLYLNISEPWLASVY